MRAHITDVRKISEKRGLIGLNDNLKYVFCMIDRATIFAIILVIFASGCISQNQEPSSVEDAARSYSEVQSFLDQKEFLLSTEKTELEADPSQEGPDFSQNCRKIHGQKDYYRIDYLASDATLSVWVRADNKEVACHAYNYPELASADVPEPRIISTEFSETLKTNSEEEWRSDKEGNISFEIRNDGESGRVMLRVNAINSTYEEISSQNKTFRIPSNTAKTINIKVYAPAGYSGFEFAVGAIRNSEMNYRTNTVYGAPTYSPDN